jgi:uncharacterized protein YcbX
MSGVEVGRVVGLWRYPVKSMGEERLEAVDVGFHGLAGDRRWAFVRPGLERSGFPWLTIREQPRLAHHRVVFADPDKPDESRTLVQTPDGHELDVTDPELAAGLGDGVRVIKHDVGVFDVMPVSVLTTASVAGLGQLVGRDLDVRRFRPNVLIEPTGDEPFPEDAWVGGTLTVGGARLRTDQRDPRCVMINVDPETTERDPAILKAVAQQRDACFGVYGSTVTPGRVAVGDVVTLEA